ncbi:GNAT family N-acetyltransferase [Paracoccus seriniphilus]|uniref:GNAT family N-acetyltransferase n=1 Tax=Paracoccus seriniphilus TaxID=184748 RepID=UPI00356953AF
MTGNQWQACRIDIHHPVPDCVMADAAALWWRGFGIWTGGQAAIPAMDAAHGMVAMQGDQLVGVAGIRDGDGGFLKKIPRFAALAYRAAPATSDMVIDGIIAREMRQGTGRALIGALVELARQRGMGGLRAEVQKSNRGARQFYASLGFVEVGRGRYGWPWTGQVLLLRHDLKRRG